MVVLDIDTKYSQNNVADITPKSLWPKMEQK